MNIYQSLVKHFGTQSAVADALHVNQGTVSGWVRGKYGMGPLLALKAEAATHGKFKAADLCPSLRSVSSHP
ncbi:Cro/CI family transcriptional regulator [Pseudomonas soli]|uniref:Cro/CI family transcriptional regulator n=1 Tax=Pseudomonas TaxID=286 RepID=UPI0039E14351